MYGVDGQENIPHREWLIAFDRVLKEVKDDFKSMDREDEFIGARVRKYTRLCLRCSPYLYLVLGYLQHHSLCFGRGVGMVPRRLLGAQAGVPSLDCRLPTLVSDHILRLKLTRNLGFDLVGPENSLKPLIDYLEPLLKFKERQKELNIDVPFIFHAGETLGDGSMADMNLYDAILLGTKRIGHG
jgi:adenosine deaminase CECR1